MMINNQKLLIEIHGTGVHNRGAELMAIAISEKILSRYPHAKIVVPSTFGHQADIKRYGFSTTLILESKKKSYIYSLVMGFLSGNIVNPAKVDVVLDASGFAFSDQWGSGAARKLATKMGRSFRNKQLFILLPQALGPFHQSDVKQWCMKLFSRASRIFARDTQSYENIKGLITDQNKLIQSPDFTIQVSALKKENIQLPNNFVAIVPNIRMLDKLENSDAYLNFLKKSVDNLIQQNMNPIFVIHDGCEDKKVIDYLGQEYSHIPTLQDEDPRVLKWILGQADFVIASRFHALVSSLSQGIPCIGAGWSHKYPELFNDFNTSDTLLEDLTDFEALNSMISQLAKNEYRNIKKDHIKAASASLKLKIDAMWNTVFKDIDHHLQQKNSM